MDHKDDRKTLLKVTVVQWRAAIFETVSSFWNIITRRVESPFYTFSFSFIDHLHWSYDKALMARKIITPKSVFTKLSPPLIFAWCFCFLIHLLLLFIPQVLLQVWAATWPRPGQWNINGSLCGSICGKSFIIIKFPSITIWFTLPTHFAHVHVPLSPRKTFSTIQLMF